VTDADSAAGCCRGPLSRGLIRVFPAAKPLKALTAKQAARPTAPRFSANEKSEGWQEWEVPFDTDADWPKALQEALTAYRAAWRAKMDEVNACIEANAEMEELVDKPEPVKGVVRVRPIHDGRRDCGGGRRPDTSPIGGAPGELPRVFDADAAQRAADAGGGQNAEAHLDKILRLLKGERRGLPRQQEHEASAGSIRSRGGTLHAEGEWINGDRKNAAWRVSIGPEVGNVSACRWRTRCADANRKGYDDVVFAGFGFDAAAQDAIEKAASELRLHMALIRPDVAMGDLLKTQPGSQLFTVFSAPRVKGPTPRTDGEYHRRGRGHGCL
jgi:adenine-specific DNA-methyltransferase